VKLYRIDYGSPAGATDVAEEQLDAYHSVEDLKKLGVLVPVEPCIHGKYDEHIKPTVEWVGVHPTEADWCLGGLADVKEER